MHPIPIFLSCSMEKMNLHGVSSKTPVEDDTEDWKSGINATNWRF